MHIAIVARDVGPSKGLEALAKGLEEQGEKVTSCLGFGKDLVFTSADAGWMQEKTYDLLVCGMSSSEILAAEELAAAKYAAAAGIPVVLYADTWGVVGRPWFSWMRPEAVFVVNEDEVRRVHGQFSTETMAVVTGNPEWEKFFLSPELSREQWRTDSGSAKPLVVNVWGKDPVVNIAIASALVDANAGDHWDLRIQKHPGDRTPDETYKSLADFGRSVWADGNLVPYADLVVESASTVGVEAACRRIPTISVFSEVAARRLEKATGSREWPLCRCGCSLRVSVGQVGSAMEQLMLCPDLLAANQEQMFPLLEQGEAVGRMTRYIKSTFG